MKNLSSVAKGIFLVFFRFLFSITVLILVGCSTDVEPEEKEEQEEIVEEEVVINPNQVVAINTGSVVGEIYNFWSTRPMVNQTRFRNSNFTQSIQAIRDYVKNYNLVRVLGGRLDDRNQFYQGVDSNGDVIADFSGLLSDLRNLKQAGFQPRIVLDNVPWNMSLPRVEDEYGNSKPPINYDIWRQYINKFLNALIDEFGITEVETWRFRVATEPNFSPNHWRGSVNDYFRHYDITVDEVLKVIPNAIVGPGNNLTEGIATFTTELIEHCANGTNLATGNKGTQMDFFSISYYEKIDQNTVRLPEEISQYRDALNSAGYGGIPLDIQEFGILRDENAQRGLSSTDGTEFGASWYATIADMAFEYGITEIYNWGQEIEASDLPQGIKHVTSMFLKMEGGNRLSTADSFTGHTGIIPATRNGSIYLLLYNHNTSRTSQSQRTMFPQIEGAEISAGASWTMSEWTVDQDNGIMMHELYKDLRASGVSEDNNGRIYGNRPSDRFGDGWEDVLNANLAKYQMMAELPQTITDSVVTVDDNGKLTLKVDMEPHAVKLIELIPE
ncbi:MAG: hypothetical protein AAGF85_05390 [Bacteroidota bacterium]